MSPIFTPHLEECLARFEIPRACRLVDALPRTTYDKVLYLAAGER